jgi:hypothetical protein
MTAPAHCVWSGPLDPNVDHFNPHAVSFSEHLDLSGRRLKQINIRGCSFEKGLSLAQAVVEGDVNIGDDNLRCDAEIERNGDGDAERGRRESCASASGEPACPATEFNNTREIDARTRIEGRLDLRGLEARALSLKGADVDDAVFNEMEIKGPAVIQYASFGTLAANNVQIGTLDAFGLRATKVDSAGIKAAFGGRFDCSIIQDISLRWLSSYPLTFVHAVVAGELRMSHSSLPSLELGGASAGRLRLEAADIARLDLTGAAIPSVEFGNGRVAALYFHGFQGQWRIQPGAVPNFAEDAEVTSRALDEQLAMGDGDAQSMLRPAYLQLSESLRDQGRMREASLLHLRAIRKTADLLDWPALFLLQGIGNPFAYAFLLLGLTALGVACIFREKDGKPPQGVVLEKDKQTLVDGGATLPTYNAWIMSLATLLPGDVLGYLRHRSFAPPSNSLAGWVTVLQLLALLTQGLLVLSIISLCR